MGAPRTPPPAQALAIAMLGLAVAAAAEPSKTPDAGAAAAQHVGWRASLQAWGYATRQAVDDDSVSNPGNLIAVLPDRQTTADVRLDLGYAGEATDAVARPRLLAQNTHPEGAAAGSGSIETYLSQAYLRWRPIHGVEATVGRDLFDWGPANFRSPSNPFYFDAGRTNPLRDVSGIDLARITAVSGPDIVTVAWVAGSGHDQRGDAFRQTAVVKVDRRGPNWIASAIAAPQRHGSTFVGGFGQLTIGEPWLVYAELGSQRLPHQLRVDTSGPLPYGLTQPSPRATTALAGASYTLENGQTITAEVLRDNHGFSRGVERREFAVAAGLDAAIRTPGPPTAAAGAALGLALANAPRLLGRDYLYLLWQSNPNAGAAYWRAGWTGNLDDHSGQFALYGELNVAERLTVFAALTANHGSRRSEFASLFGASATVGAKFFAF